MSGGKLNFVQIGSGIAIGIVLGVGFLTLRNQTQPAPIIIQPAPTVAPPEPTATPAPMSVFVNGAVSVPGVYQLPADARVEDAVLAAGGFSAEAYSDGVNMAQLLFDGAQVYVSTMEQSAEIEQTLLANPVQGQPVDSGNSGSESTISLDGVVDLNSASRADLETIPGIGPATAQSIVSYREDNGPFTDIEEVMNVSGIGEGKFEQMKDYLSVGE